MKLVFAALTAFILDLLLGDPAWLPHPVVGMGRCITALERRLRDHFPATPGGERRAGVILAAVLPLGTLLLSGGACALAWIVHPWLWVALNAFWGWQALAMRGLRDESRRVYRALTEQSLPEARAAVGRIVGRDTQNLSEAGVIRAAIETVAENFSDGVFAPLLYLVIGGAPLALAYKAINTMDSMVGYKNQRYRHFGRAAARLDDAANFIPARLAALVMIAATLFVRESTSGAWRIWRRDRRNHASPNSAQTEAVMAGALGVQLAGSAWYFGERYDKPTIGDSLRAVEPGDILRANRLLYAAGLLGLLLLLGARAFLVAMR